MTHEHIGIDCSIDLSFDPNFLEQSKRNNGCVVRTFESIAGVKATDAEYQERIIQILGGPLRLSSEDTELPEDFAKRVLLFFDTEITNVEALFRRFQAHITPLGRALSSMDIQAILATLTQYQMLAEKGNKVALAIPGHMFHLGSVDGRLVMLSDVNHPVSLPLSSDSLLPGFVFTPKVPAE